MCTSVKYCQNNIFYEFRTMIVNKKSLSIYLIKLGLIISYIAVVPTVGVPSFRDAVRI